VGLALFDFDGTLTTRDTIRPLGAFLVEHAHAGSRAKMAGLLLLLAGLKGRALSNHVFKERFCDLLLRGQNEAHIEGLADDFANICFRSIVNPRLVYAMRAHQTAGDDVFILSSNFTFALMPWQRRWNATGIIATNAEIHAGRFTGRLNGRACEGRQKLTRALAQFGPARLRHATAYGDSRSDRHIMGIVERAIWV
jgi:phosphatidylglycerophosphatase C